MEDNKMEETVSKVTYAKNLNKQNFSASISIPIDTNVNIKTILQIDSYLFDEKVECGNGKAIMSGKIGVKVLYVDKDNITNTITDSLTFSETILDNSITSDSYINISDIKIVNQVLNKEGNLKINCDIFVLPVMYVNLGLGNNLNTENMICKKKEVSTNTISCFVDSAFDYTVNLETKENISKVLMINSTFNPDKLTPRSDCIEVEGKLFTIVVYETEKDGENIIKKLVDTTAVKAELPVANQADCVADLNFTIDKSKEVLDTVIEDGASVVTISYKVKAKGVCLMPVNIEVVEDLYSTAYEVDLAKTKREFNKVSACSSFADNIAGEVSITDEESAIDDIVANVDIVPEITNKYIKDNYLYFEGVISSTIIYIDEFKEYQQKHVELPYIINTKIEMEKLDCAHASISVEDTHAKAKRGTIIEVEYAVCFNVCAYSNNNVELIDSVAVKNPLDFGAYDYQIYIAKPMETMWELGKRIKISPDEILKLNKDLPLIMAGKEKILIKRN